jgi:hypothetical protein
MADYSKLLTGLQPGAEYVVQIRSKNTDGEASEWSNGYNFSTPDAPTPKPFVTFGQSIHPLTNNTFSGSIYYGPAYLALVNSAVGTASGAENFIVSSRSGASPYFRTTIGTGFIGFGWNNEGAYSSTSPAYRQEYATISLNPNKSSNNDSVLEIQNLTGSITFQSQNAITMYNTLRVFAVGISGDGGTAANTSAAGDIWMARGPEGRGGYAYFGASAGKPLAYIGYGNWPNRIEISDPVTIRGSLWVYNAPPEVSVNDAVIKFGLTSNTVTASGLAYLLYSNSNSRFTFDKDGTGNVANLLVTGNITASGALNVSSSATARGFITSSDERIKRNINPIHDNGLFKKINNLIPVEYNLISNSGEVNGRKSFGFVAQQVNDIFPNIVYGPTETESEYESRYHLDYTALIPILTKAIQLQQIQIEQLTESVTQLQNDIIGLGG